MDDLIAAIVDVRDKLRRGAYSNEDQVSRGVVMRLLQQLGWDVYDPIRVSAEFRIGSRKVDYALLHDPFGAVVLIEVKDVGKASTSGEDQLFDYCLKQGVPVAVLTDGRTWNFYWPAGRGNYAQRRFAVSDLVDHEASECASVLNRYLAFNAVTSGQFEEAARHDYAAYQQQIVAKQQFAPVWHALIREADPRVVRLFADEVERCCGIRPDEERVRSFLSKQFAHAAPPESAARARRSPSRSTLTPAQGAGQVGTAKNPGAKAQTPLDPRPESPSFTLFGREFSCQRDKDVLVGVLTALGKRDPGLYARLAPLLAGRKRSFLSRDRKQIYPQDSAAAVLRSVEKLPGGWWLGTHSSTRTKNDQLRRAREVAGLTAGQFTWQMKGKT